jgi:S1-C subfamily serine protease
MSITGKLTSDGFVYVACPQADCKSTLKIKPKSAKSTVTCAKCGHKFPLEVEGMGAGSTGSSVAPPPVPTSTEKNRVGERSNRNAESPKVKRPPHPWEVDEEERRHERQARKQSKKSTPVGLIVGGIAAALLVIGGIGVGLVYAMRDREPQEKPTTPLASAPATETTADDSRPPIDTAKKEATSTTENSPVAPKFETPKTPAKQKELDTPIVKEDPAPPMPDPDSTTPIQGKGPKKKGQPSKGAPVATGSAIDRVKKSTALIEAKGGWGTGFVIKPGIVMTNTHVIAGKRIEDLRVSFVSIDDTAPPPLKATLLYTDPRRDLAILRVDTDRPPLDIAPSGTELKGLEVAIVGNPKGDAGQAEINKVTTGRLSAPIRRDAGWTYYELNAQAYFGNSGGPVVDAKTGKLVGVIQSILGDGKQKSYCIPYGEALRALESLPASKEDEPKATRIALGRHYIEYIDEHLPEMEKRAELAMAGQLNRLRAKAFGADITITLTTTDGRSQTFSLTEFMAVLKEKHTETYPTFNKVMPYITASQEIPSSVKRFLRERIETYLSMYALANQGTKTEKAFIDAMDARKAANVRKEKEFKDAYDKWLDDLERKPIEKPK